MKKILAVLFLITFLAVLAVPLVTSAQVRDCCTIKRGFQFETFTATSSWCIAEAKSSCTSTQSVIGKCYADADTKFGTTTSWGIVCILNSIYRVSDLAFAVLVAFSILMILLAAYTFMTAAGTPQKVEQARNYVLYALVGLIVAFLARAIPAIVGMLM